MVVSCNNTVKEVHYSGHTISKIYACGELVYSASTEPLGVKLLMKYSNGDEYSKDCSGQTEDLSRVDTIIEGKDYSTVTSATIGDCVTYIAPMSFYAFSGLTNVSIPNTVTNIATNAFTVCKALHTVTLPNSLRHLGASVFKECINLESIVIPSGVIQIMDEAFNVCPRLTSITCLAVTPPTLVGTQVIIDDQVVTTYSQFNGSTCPIYVPAETVETYKNTTGWETFANRIQAIP